MGVFSLEYASIMSWVMVWAQFNSCLPCVRWRKVQVPLPSPVWQREILNARNPPRVTFTHHEFDEVIESNSKVFTNLHDIACGSFFFGLTQVSAIWKSIPHHLRKSSTFEILIACLWQCCSVRIPNPWMP